MSLKPQLQKISGWVSAMATGAKEATGVAFESGLLKDTVEDMCKVGGVAGALFKLGNMAIPDPDPEQRMASALHQAFLRSLDKELVKYQRRITKTQWKKYVKERLPQVATQGLAAQFTWLSIFGSHGRKPSRSWPIVGALADLSATWIAEAMAHKRGRTDEVREAGDDVRGRVHEALAKTVDELVATPEIQKALTEATPGVLRDALALVAEELTTRRDFRLFNEFPQHILYVSPKIKTVDLSDPDTTLEWDEIEVEPNGDDALFAAVQGNSPRLVVVQGDMGVGKSCLMRELASRLAEKFLRDRRSAPVFVRWRDLYDKADLAKAIADELHAEYGLPLHELPEQSDITYLVDGFDEMRSHQEGFVSQCFDTLAGLVRRGCTVVVAMRTSVVTQGLQRAWKNHRVFLVHVEPFDDKLVDAWAQKWRAANVVSDVTGKRLRGLCEPTKRRERFAALKLEPKGGSGIVHNPLLLYMLAKYVLPTASNRAGQLTQSEVFQIFVDETIQGKVRAGGEQFPIAFDERQYRMLLQELAYIASWPSCAPKCPYREVQRSVDQSVIRDLNFEDLRTAFVLHFFEPGNVAENEFEFHPEGFRQYLLAEWCVRAQVDALEERQPQPSSLQRTRDKAMNALAQVALRERERDLLNDIYEGLGRLASGDPGTLTQRLQAFGLDLGSDEAAGLPQRLYERVRGHSEIPPKWPWEDMKVGIPEGSIPPPALDQLRLVVNYWDQCLLGALGLYRGLSKDAASETVFAVDASALARFTRARNAVGGHSWELGMRLDRLGLDGADLDNIELFDLHGTGLYARKARLVRAVLSRARLSGANLEGAYLEGAYLAGADLSNAALSNAALSFASLSHANLSGAGLRRTRIASADLTDADLTDADLTGADLTGADLTGARVTTKQLETTHGKPAHLPDGSTPDDGYENLDAKGAKA